MQVHCPKCERLIEADDINVSTDVAICWACSETFKLSEALEMEGASAVDLDNPPKGAWFERTFDGFIVGATTRSPLAFFIIPFACALSGASIAVIYGSQVAKGGFDLTASLFGIPFLLGSLLLWWIALMFTCGRVTVSADGPDGSVFTGVGSLGWRRRFYWPDVTSVREEEYGRRNSSPQKRIVIEGKHRIGFGIMLSEQRRYFVLQALRQMLTKRLSA